MQQDQLRASGVAGGTTSNDFPEADDGRSDARFSAGRAAGIGEGEGEGTQPSNTV